MIPVRSSVGSGFPVVRKERTLLSDARNYHQPSYALSFSDPRDFSITFKRTLNVKRGILRQLTEGKGAV